jgi:hypothetical protein
MYLQGRETSVELFSPAGYDLDAPPAAVGKLGIALSTEEVGGLSRIQAVMKRASAEAKLSTAQRIVDGRKIDWFRSLEPTAPAPAVSAQGPTVEIWAMEYLASYFEARTDNEEPPENDKDIISRERYRSDEYRQHLMRDVIGLTLAVTRDDWNGLRPLLAAAGMRIVEDRVGAQASGKALLRFQFVPRALVGLRQVEFALNSAPSETHLERLGHSSLAVARDGRAVWSFDPPMRDPRPTSDGAVALRSRGPPWVESSH